MYFSDADKRRRTPAAQGRRSACKGARKVSASVLFIPEPGVKRAPRLSGLLKNLIISARLTPGSGMNNQRTALALRATEAGTLLAPLPASIRVPFLHPPVLIRQRICETVY